MTDCRPARRYTFGTFELDTATGELRRNGLRIKLHTQPFQILVMLLERPGEMLTREEISRSLWPDGTFVDFEHGVNSAVNRLREALGDKASNPRFVETLARRGYRFVAPVRQFPLAEEPSPETQEAKVEAVFATPILAVPDELPKNSRQTASTLFILLQAMYLAFYVGALANLGGLHEILAGWMTDLVAVTAALLIPVRAFLLCAALFRAPGFQRKALKIWPFLLPLDWLWSLAPFLLHYLNYGLALACTTLLVYSPFAQRSLILMGAGEKGHSSLPH